MLKKYKIIKNRELKHAVLRLMQGKWSVSLKKLAFVMIKYQSSKQISIADFVLPFSGSLNEKNKWVVLAHTLPWDQMVNVYVKRMSLNKGRRAIDPRVAIGSLIIKHYYSLTDEATIELIKENPYLQYFLGFTEYSYEQPFTSSLFVSIRKRLGEAEFKELNEELISYFNNSLEAKSSAGKSTRDRKPSDKDENNRPSNSGHLIVDATVAPSDIKFPTDLDLLNEAREKAELLIDLLYVPEKGKTKPRTYRKNARRDYLRIAKQKKKSKKKIRQAIKKQLNYLRRDLKIIEQLLDEKQMQEFPLAYKYQRMYWIIQEVYRQQRYMYEQKTHKIEGRIVSLSQPYIRPIVRGKAGSDVEFGAKISVSLVNGYAYLDRINWEAYNEGGDLINQIECYKARFGFYPEYVSGDAKYGTRENRAYMKERNIKFTGPSLGRPKQDKTVVQRDEEKLRKKKSKERNQIEGSFGVAKRRYDLDLVKAKRQDTSESWIGAVYLVMNISQFLREIFWPILQKAILKLKKYKNLLNTVVKNFGFLEYKLIF